MSSSLTDFIKGNRHFFESSQLDIHGGEKQNSIKLLQDRRWELGFFIKQQGIYQEELNHAFGESSSLSETQKKMLVESLILFSELDDSDEISKFTINNFIQNSKYGEEVLSDHPAIAKNISDNQSKLTSSATTVDSIEAALDTVIESQKTQFVINDLQSFVAVIEDDKQLRYTTAPELKNYLVNSITFGEESEQSKELHESLAFIDDLELSAPEEVLQSLKEKIDNTRTASNAKILDRAQKLGFETSDELISGSFQLANEAAKCPSNNHLGLGEKAIQMIDNQLELLGDDAPEVKIDPELRPLILDKSGEVVHDNSEYGALYARPTEDTNLVTKFDRDFTKEAHAIMLDNEITLSRVPSKFENARLIVEKGRSALKGDKSDLDKILNATLTPEQEPETRLGRFLKKVPIIKDRIGDKPEVDKLTDSPEKGNNGLSVLKNRNGTQLATISNKERIYNRAKGTNPSFHASYDKAGFMKPEVHKLVALKAKEAGIKKPIVILPSAKGITEEQKVEFFKSNYRSLMEAGYMPDEIGMHNGSLLPMNSKLKAKLNEAIEEINGDFIHRQAADDFEIGGLAGEDMLEELDFVTQKAEEVAKAEAELKAQQQLAQQENQNLSATADDEVALAQGVTPELKEALEAQKAATDAPEPHTERKTSTPRVGM